MLYSTFQKRLRELVPSHTNLDAFYGMQFGEQLHDHNLRKIAVTLQPSKKMIIEAIKEKCSMILSLHGLCNAHDLQITDFTINQVKLLAMNNIKLFVVSSGWECAQGGILEALANYLGLKIVNNFFLSDKVTDNPVGRIVVPQMELRTLSQLVESFKRHFQLSKIQISGTLQTHIQKLLIIDGIRITESVLLRAAQSGADTLLTCEVSYYHSLCAQNLKLNIISLPRHKFEEIGVKALQKLLSLEFPRDEFIYIKSDYPYLLV